MGEFIGGGIISNKIDKPKRTANELITMLRDSKGIRFVYMDEATAAAYLLEKNNYLRTASYRKNYSKRLDGPNAGDYIDLDFAYLAELSTLDMHLRFILLKMCIDVEHALKVKILTHIEDCASEDGYSIVESFLKKYPKIEKSIEEKADSVFTGDLISKYFELCSVFDCANNRITTKIKRIDCPAWVLVEIIGFHNLVAFYEYYYSLHSTIEPINKNIINSIRSLRNACAHNNCLLNSLNRQATQPPGIISEYISQIKTIGKEERKKKLSCRPLFEIVCLLYEYDSLVSKDVRDISIDEFKNFINNCVGNKGKYFNENQVISTSFNFLKKVVDNMA